MTYSVTTSGTGTQIKQDGSDIITADASGNVSVKSGGAVKSITTIAGETDLGVGQTWQNLTASRAFGVTYTNSTGKPIFVTAANAGNGSLGITPTVNGVQLSTQLSGAAGFTQYPCCWFVVPAGQTYRVDFATVNGLFMWAELR